MEEMIRDSGLDVAQIVGELWMDEQQIRCLHGKGHYIGLHSHSHPTKLSALSREDQYGEYSQNQRFIADLIGDRVVTMSHPNSSYNDDSLSVLEQLGIALAFVATMGCPARSKLEFPREDHVNILREMEEAGK